MRALYIPSLWFVPATVSHCCSWNYRLPLPHEPTFPDIDLDLTPDWSRHPEAGGYSSLKIWSNNTFILVNRKQELVSLKNNYFLRNRLQTFYLYADCLQKTLKSRMISSIFTSVFLQKLSLSTWDYQGLRIILNKAYPRLARISGLKPSRSRA